MVILEQDAYLSIWRDYSLSNTDREVIVRLYGPLVGIEALSLYFSLDTILGSASRYEYMFVSDLAGMLDTTITRLDEVRRKLEACALLETYRNETPVKVNYIFKLLPPMTPQQFFSKKNITLRGLLNKKMGNKYIVDTKSHFAIDSKISKDYVDVSSSIHSVFTIDFDTDKAYYSLEDNNVPLQDKKNKTIEEQFDDKKFIKVLKSLQFDYSLIEDQYSEIKRIAVIYGMNEESSAKLVVKATTSNGYFSLDSFKDLATNSIRYGNGQKTSVQSGLQGEGLTARTIKKYENTSPYDFLAQASGVDPIKSELKLIDKISKEYGFSSGIINFILDYTLQKCDQKLPEQFVLKIASTLKRQKVESAYDAMVSLYQSERKNIKVKKAKRQDGTSEKSESINEVVSDTSTIDINELIGDEL